METISNPYIRYNIEKVREVKFIYDYNLKEIAEEYPFNLNSTQQIIEFCSKKLAFTPENAKIKTLEQQLTYFDSDSPEFNCLYGIVMYLKLKYSVKNYIDCILRHEQNGLVPLRIVDGDLKMPNRQPISSNPEITECQEGDIVWV